MADGYFSPDTVQTLGRRAALLCSNPDCGVLTTGPTAEANGATNIGEAAHIYGRTERSARFNAALSLAELADITNGIWLCRNCHKAADNDAARFPSDLLFEWRRRHEASVLARIGKPGDQVRERLDQERLLPFSSVSNLARQIVLDRPKLWEYKLALELLRSEFAPVINRWKRLERGMYVQKSLILDTDKVLDWFGAQNDDLSRTVQSIPPLLQALTDSFGPPGTPGNDREILEVCRLLVATAQRLLEWEEDVRFVRVPEKYRELIAALQGGAGQVLQDVFGIEAGLARIVGAENPTGLHEINIVLKLPDGWAKRITKATKKLNGSWW